ncbi:DUF4435 domain-containing protein [Bacteroidales bacterium SW299]|nr:DUF4435 domain-containing protein [Bacteroidales bacterium SW299]
MGKRLTENLSSLYIGAANKLKPKHARRKIVAYVESYDDISFWRTLLSEYENDSRYFEVMLPSRTSLAKGKKTVLMNQLGNQLGENMIACVDSDYDYLLQGCTNTSRYMLKCPYVMQTYAYAIENYHCYAEGLHDVCVMATLNDHKLVDFPEFMKQYSQIAYPLFIWSIWFYRHHILSEFSLMDFCSYVKLDHVNTYHPEWSLEAMERKVKRKLRDLEHKHRNAIPEIESMKTELKELGVHPNNTYMFIQGHHIMDNVVMRLLIPVCTILRREREQQIHSLALHSMQLQNELTNYERCQVNVEQVIHRNTNYTSSPLYQMIRKDIEKFLKIIK